eukprot:Awhi_evm1s1826
MTTSTTSSTSTSSSKKSESTTATTNMQDQDISLEKSNENSFAAISTGIIGVIISFIITISTYRSLSTSSYLSIFDLLSYSSTPQYEGNFSTPVTALDVVDTVAFFVKAGVVGLNVYMALLIKRHFYDNSKLNEDKRKKENGQPVNCKSNDDKKGNRILFVTAHPDDECMFFGPSILHLLKDPNNTVLLLCLSEGM